MHHGECLDRLIGGQMLINMGVMISKHSRLLLVSIVSLGSYESIVVITLFRYSIHGHSLVILILSTIDRRQIVLVDGLINNLELPVWLRSIVGVRELCIPLLFELIFTSDSKLVLKHLLGGSTVVSLLVSRFELQIPQINNFLVHNLL